MFLSGSWIIDLAAVVASLCAVVYYCITAKYEHWKKLNVPYVQPKFPFGNFGKSRKMSFVQMMDEFYPKCKENGFVGIYSLLVPVLLVTKPEIIKHILTKDFSAFHDRGLPHDEKHDPYSAHLFNLEGQRWKTLRAKLSPTFTSGKIKGMFPLIHECTQELVECVRKSLREKNGSVDMKDWLGRFSTDVIGTCAFGMKCNALSDPSTEFHTLGRDILRRNFKNTFRHVVVTIFPIMAKYLTFDRCFPKTTEFFNTLMTRTVQYRKENSVERNDFVQLMMKIMEEDSNGMPFTPKVMTAQALIFFLAGSDNVANPLGFSLHHLALDPDLQERVNQDITSVLKESSGEITYEAIGKMDLVTRVLDESLRMYSPAGALMRKLNQDKYIIPGTNIALKKGTSVMIPIQSIQNDEEYFPNPKKFDPDRFTEEEKSKRHPYAYLPFGEGPRFCVAERFANLEMRLCLAELIRNFTFSVAPETDLSLETDKAAFGPSPTKGFWLRVEERSSL